MVAKFDRTSVSTKVDLGGSSLASVYPPHPITSSQIPLAQHILLHHTNNLTVLLLMTLKAAGSHQFDCFEANVRSTALAAATLEHTCSPLPETVSPQTFFYIQI